jgi:hypothetical protein
MKRNDDDMGNTATMNPPPRVRDENQAGKPGADREEMMKRAEAAGKPGLGHKALEHCLGNWRAEVKCWSEPGGPANVSEATANVSWTMSGRYLQEDFEGEMMGKPFRGRTLIGYDNIKQTFQSVWISDMQTSMFVTEGKGEDGNKVITLRGTASCPMRERGDIPMKLVLRVIGPDKHTLEMFDESQGKSTKTMEITYIRT